MLEPVLRNPWVRAAGLVAALVLVAVGVYLLSPVLVPLFFAFLVAYVLDPVVEFCERLRISRTVSIGAMAGLGVAFLLAIPLVFVPLIIKDADELSEAATVTTEERQGVTGWFYDQVRRLPLQEVVEAMGWDDEYLAQHQEAAAEEPAEPGAEEAPREGEAAPEGEGDQAEPAEPEDAAETGAPPVEGEGAEAEALPYDPLVVITDRIAEAIRGPAIGFLESHAGEIGRYGQTAGASLGQFFASIGRVILNTLLFLGNLALFTFVAAYLLKDYETIVGTARDLIPRPYLAKISSIMGKINAQLRSFIRGQVLVALCLGVIYAIGLVLSGVPFALLLGAFGAVANFVPYLGLVLTAGPAVVLCILQHGLDLHLAGVVATFGVAQLLEGAVITPKIVGEQVGLGPVWVILAILVFGNALGFLGLLLAVPIAASLKVLVVEAVEYYKNSAWYKARTEGA